MTIGPCSFLELRTAHIGLARTFWVDQLGFSVIEEEPGNFFAVDAGGLRLCIDVADAPGVDVDDSMMIGFKVRSIVEAALQLAMRGLRASEPPRPTASRPFLRLRDPDGRLVVLMEDAESSKGAGLRPSRTRANMTHGSTSKDAESDSARRKA